MKFLQKVFGKDLTNWEWNFFTDNKVVIGNWWIEKSIS